MTGLFAKNIYSQKVCKQLITNNSMQIMGKKFSFNLPFSVLFALQKGIL